MERLQKYMAHAGVASRRKSEEIIKQGKVKVNGKIVTEMGVKINPEIDLVEVDGELIYKEKKIYLILNKPEGYVTTVFDPRGRKTVMDLLPALKERVYPTGRLDYDSCGLLLMTNNGELTYKLTHPSFEIDKTYLVKIEGNAVKNELLKLEEGIELEDGMTAPAFIENVKYKSGYTTFRITLHEGRNREIRRMCKKIGYNVIKLMRISFANLKLGNLREGEFRYLSSEEKKGLEKIS